MTTEPTEQSAADLFVEALENEGVKYIFGVPGDENLRFVEAVRKSSVLEFVLTRHEQVAGMMASTCGRLTGKIAVAMSTLGAGAANLTTALAQAYVGGFPMLAITGQKPIRDNQQGWYQLVDVVNLFTPITKYSATVPSGEALPAIVHEALHQALEERPGPAHIELPNDVAADRGDYRILPNNQAPTPHAPEASIELAAEMIQAAKRPVLLLGIGANHPHPAAAVRGLVWKTGIPQVSTMMGKGVVDERGETFIGTAVMAGDYTDCALAGADLVVNIGHDTREKPVLSMQPGDDRKVIHVNAFAANVNPVYFPQHQVVGDIAHSVKALCRIVECSDWNFEGLLNARAAVQRSITAPVVDAAEMPVKPQQVVAQLRDFMKPNDIVTIDNGLHMMWMTRNYAACEPLSLIVDHALGSMGTGLPAAMAAKLVRPNHTVVAVVGDGGFMMNIQDLETAVRLELDLIVLVFNDGGLGMIRLKQMSDGFGELGVDFNNPDFPDLARSMGGHGHRVEAPAQLAGILTQAKVAGGVHVVDIPIDYRESVKLKMELASLDCSKLMG